MILALFICGGFVLGFVIGRWWVLAAPTGWGIYVWVKAQDPRYAHTDIPWRLIVVVYVVISSIAIVSGLLARRLARRFANPS